MTGVRRRRHEQPGLTTVPAPVAAVAVVGVLLLIVPVMALLVEAPWSSVVAELTNEATLSAVRVSMIVSLTATAASVLLGVPLAYTLARLDFWGKPLIRTVVTVPLVLPPVVTGVALLAGFGRRSALGQALGFGLSNSMVGAIVAATVVAMPFLVLSVEGSLRASGTGHEELAASLGAPPLARWWRISLPMARPAIVAGAVLAWARALGEFGATITFAGNISGVSRTLPLEIATALEASRERAVALSLLMLFVSLAVLTGLRDRWVPRS